MKKNNLTLIILFLQLATLPMVAQQAQIGENSRTLLVWPFDESFYIDQYVGSHGWNMICGPGCGYHTNSDQSALDWSRYGLSSCGAVFNAPLSGTVLYVRLGSNTGYGNQVIIQSDQDSTYAFRMAHMQEVWVGSGDYVEAGEPIGRVGDTGNGGCHGHLAMYRKIYDRAENVLQPIDSNQVYKRAIDYLKIGEFVPTPYENPAYFSEPFSFVRDQEGIVLDLFSVEDFHFAVEDSIRVKARIRNLGEQEWTGVLALDIQDEEIYRYSSLSEHIGESDTFTLYTGNSKEFQLVFPLTKFDPGLYFVHLLFVSEARSSDLLTRAKVWSPLRSAHVQLLSKEDCNLDEPNDEPGTATLLFPEPLSNPVKAQKKEGLISVFGDEKDVYTFQTMQPGRMKINFTDTIRFSMEIYNESGPVSVSGKAGLSSFITEPGVAYFIEFSARPDCNRPYEFRYEWTPVERVAWQMTVADQLNSELTVLEAAVIEWQIIDLMGRRLFSSGKKMLEPGAYFNTFPLDNVSPGVYLAALFVDGRLTEHKKFFWHP